MEETKLTIELGRKYKLRNGFITSPIRKARNGGDYKFEAVVREPNFTKASMFSWKSNGKFLTDQAEHIYDIIAPH